MESLASKAGEDTRLPPLGALRAIFRLLFWQHWRGPPRHVRLSRRGVLGPPAPRQVIFTHGVSPFPPAGGPGPVRPAAPNEQSADMYNQLTSPWRMNQCVDWKIT